jgi:hypothetical protein
MMKYDESYLLYETRAYYWHGSIHDIMTYLGIDIIASNI